VMNRARVRPGSTVAVFGAGGVGLSVVMTCRLAGARGIVVVDPFPSRRALAVELGATDTRDPSDPAPDGCDYAFEAAGHPASAAKALSALRPGGTLVAVGLPPDGSTVSLPWPELVRGEKVVAGTFYGSARPRIDIPLILGLYAEGRLPLDRLIGRRYPLEGVNEAFADMGAGLAGRALLTP
jgi:Zn-dependent alcohol dehydrogenase